MSRRRRFVSGRGPGCYLPPEPSAAFGCSHIVTSSALPKSARHGARVMRTDRGQRVNAHRLRLQGWLSLVLLASGGVLLLFAVAPQLDHPVWFAVVVLALGAGETIAYWVLAATLRTLFAVQAENTSAIDVLPSQLAELRTARPQV